MANNNVGLALLGALPMNIVPKFLLACTDCRMAMWTVKSTNSAITGDRKLYAYCTQKHEQTWTTGENLGIVACSVRNLALQD